MRTFLAISLLLVATLCVSAQNHLKVGASAPQFSGTSIDGGVYDLEKLRGKVVLVTFWSTRCEICRSEVPKLNSLTSRYAERDVEFLAFSTEDEAKIKAFVKHVPFRFRIMPDGFGTLLKFADRDKEGRLNIGFPSYFLIDPNGTLAYRGSGWDRTDEIIKRIDKILPAAGTSVGR